MNTLAQGMCEPVLTGETSSGQKLEMIRQGDGSLSITFDGNSNPACIWPNDKLEQCVAVYLAILRSAEPV